jgi:endonuclease I
MFDSYTTTELSSMDEWSNATASQGLHHYTTENYLYRSSYYAGATDLMGESLLSYLHDLMIETHTNYVNYATARTTAILTDADPLQPGNIILIYSGLSTSGVWDNGITWNREHVWPKALSGGLYTSVSNSDTGAGADLHQLKPAASNINSSRGSKMYGAQTTETTFAPRDEVKGDVARILFYMAVHYNMDIVELNVAESISLLLDWNNQDNVDAFERIRNNAVQNIQGNYNPFIDNPWFATLIWG